MKYRKKPVEIEAVQWTGNNINEIIRLAEQGIRKFEFDNDFIYIDTLEGTMSAQKGDYIIKGVKGELYPCKPDIFEMTYERVE